MYHAAALIGFLLPRINASYKHRLVREGSDQLAVPGSDVGSMVNQDTDREVLLRLLYSLRS